MNNTEFLEIIKQTFLRFLDTGSRSNEKLKILHGAIARDLSNGLGDNFQVKSLGFGEGKEATIQGRYINKNVDIVVLRNDKPVAGIGIKFVQQNYSQNSNNYFENMLGETANIRSSNIPYFQIFIIPKKLPYYKNGGSFDKWETFSAHHIEKYRILSADNEEYYLHTPNKTLLYVLDIKEIKQDIFHKSDYIAHYSNAENLEINTITIENITFSNGVILNDYNDFVKKIMHRILSI